MLGRGCCIDELFVGVCCARCFAIVVVIVVVVVVVAAAVVLVQKQQPVT